jgi:hypothetical protein
VISGVTNVFTLTQDVHSDRLKRPETAIKRRIKALIFTVFRSFSGMTDYGDVLTPVFAVFYRFPTVSGRLRRRGSGSGYMCLTGHYILSNNQFISKILSFTWFRHRHFSSNI